MAIAQQLPAYLLPPRTEFTTTIREARDLLMVDADEAVAFAARVVPVYAQRDVDPYQERVGGCRLPGGRKCTYLGLWANGWADPEFPDAPHGRIFLFEEGIRTYGDRLGVDLFTQVYDTYLHEIGHALQRDHVLEALKAEQRAQALAEAASARPFNDVQGMGAPCG